MTYPKVAVVILNWNGQKYLEKFLPSVVSSTYQNLEIVVGDNFSTDDSIEYLKSNYPEIKIISNDKNYGFAEGYNKVLSTVEADYYVLLNSDVEVTKDWIQPVIELMETDDSIAAAQPKLLSYHDKTKFEYAGAAGGFLDKYGYPFCRGRIFETVETEKGQYNQASEIFWASGAALFIKAKYWKEVNGLDADFFAHMEEIDLCWRLKNNGYKIMYCPDSIVYHVGGGTLEAENPFKTYLNFRNNLLMLQKNLPGSKAFSIIFIRFWFDFITLLKYLLAGKPKNAFAISRAHFSFLGSYGKTRLKSSKRSIAYNNSGLYEGSIVWQYFIKKKKTFKDLKI
ncbi:MAG: putative glycosyltransferase [Sphingobacteriales bacterium]|nr:putative glycosyltransferase [Sphingobacteriales bacterium]